MRFACLWAVVFCLVAAAWAGGGESRVPEDEVLMLKGKPRVGRIVHVNDDRIVLRQKSRLEEIPQSEVASYTSVNENLSAVMPDLGVVSQSIETAGMSQLAKLCVERGLPNEADLVWWSILRLDPENEEAHKELGHKFSSNRWKFRLAESQLDMESLADLKPKWGKAFELSTTHFDVRSNMGWFDTVKATLMAEQIYVLIFHSLGNDFQMYWPTERMQLHLHGDGSFPGGARFKGLVDIDIHRVAIDAEAGFRAWFLARHLAELILTEAIREESKPTVNFPMWMKIGMEEYTVAVLGFDQNDGDVIRFNPDNRHILNQQTHKAAKDPFGLTRVLNFGDGDFKAEDNTLQRAECYTLFNFCSNGQNGEKRKQLFEFFKMVKSGKASSTDFKEAFQIRRGKAEEEFEEAWIASLQ